MLKSINRFHSYTEIGCFYPRLPSVPTRIVVAPCFRLSVHPSVRPERRYQSYTLRILAISLKFGGMEHSTRSRYLCKMAMLSQFLRVSNNLDVSMIGLERVRRMMTHISKCEEIISWPEIWLHDAMYHEADHYLKWRCSASVCFIWSRSAQGAVVL